MKEQGVLMNTDQVLLSSWNLTNWCKTRDPVSRNVAWKARTEFYRLNSNKELEEWVDALNKQLAEGWEKIKVDSEGFYTPDYYRGMVNGEHTWDEPDSADLLLRLHELGWWGKEDPKRKEKKNPYPVEDAEALLHLLCLSESRRGNYGLAIKAYLLAASERARRALEDAGLAQKKGGEKEKRCKAIFELTKEIVRENPTLKAPGIWKRIPEEVGLDPETDRVTLDGTEYDVYRDDNPTDPIDPNSKIHQQEQFRASNGALQQGQIKSIKYSSWRAYVTAAKKEVAKN